MFDFAGVPAFQRSAATSTIFDMYQNLEIYPMALIKVYD